MCSEFVSADFFSLGIGEGVLLRDLSLFLEGKGFEIFDAIVDMLDENPLAIRKESALSLTNSSSYLYRGECPRDILLLFLLPQPVRLLVRGEGVLLPVDLSLLSDFDLEREVRVNLL